MVDQAPPLGWGNDEVTKFIDAVRGNQFGTFYQKRSLLADLASIDGLFRRALSGTVDPKPILPMLFALRAHSAYLTACSLVMAGQLFEASTMHRLCLETAGYGVFVGDDTERGKRWLQRHDEPGGRTQVRKEFTAKAVEASIRARSPKLAGIYQKVYEESIDYGAPSQRARLHNEHAD
jgi:hypothetical protein